MVILLLVFGRNKKRSVSIASIEVGGMVNFPSSEYQVKSIPTSYSFPLTEKKTPNYNDRPLKIGLHINGYEH
jgi:hypothetical protein